MTNLNLNEKQIVDMICTAYITVYGQEKWNSLTVEEQHDVIMTIASDLAKAL